MTLWLSQGAVGTTGVLSEWAQLGGLGILTGFLVVAVRVLFMQETRNLDHERAVNAKALEEANKRADRLEEELREVNRLLQERILSSLVDATRTLAHTLDTDRREAGKP